MQRNSLWINYPVGPITDFLVSVKHLVLLVITFLSGTCWVHTVLEPVIWHLCGMEVYWETVVSSTRFFLHQENHWQKLCREENSLVERMKQEIEKLEEYDVWDQPEIIIIFCHSSPSNTLFHLFWVVYLSKIQFNPISSYGN